MAGSTLAMQPRSSTTLPAHPGRNRRNRPHSYLEKIHDISRELDFIRLNQQTSFIPGGSPQTPLSATKTMSFVFEGNALPRVSPAAQHHYREPGPASGSTTLPHNTSRTPYYNKLDASPNFTEEYNAITAGIQSLTTSPQQQPASTQTSRPSISSPLTSPLPTSSPGASPGYLVSPRSWNNKVPVMIPERKMELTHMTRILHSKPIWYLPDRPRVAATHYLQPHPVGTFVVRQGRQGTYLRLTMKHPGQFINNYTLDVSLSGKIKWSQSNREFNKIEDLVEYHMLVEEKLPCRLVLPEDIMNAKHVRELQSLAVLEEEFWKPRSSASPLLSPEGTTIRNATIPNLQESLPSTPGISDHETNSPYQIPPTKSEHPYQIPPPVTMSDTQRKNNYLSLLSPMSPMLVRTEYVNMPLKTVKPLLSAPPVMNPSSTPPSQFQSFPPSRKLSYEPNRTYQSWGPAENQLRSVQRMTSQGSIESISVGPFQRQPMRYSTQSERDSLVKDAGMRYPPPSCSPPPPPPPGSSHVKDKPSSPQLRPHGSIIPLASRQSDAYYTPHEYTKNGHTQMYSPPPPDTSAPPIPTKTRLSMRDPNTMYPSYQMPSTTQTSPAVSGVYADPTRLPAPVACGYSVPPTSTSQDDQKRLSDSGVCLLEPVKISGQPEENSLFMFDPLVLAESRTVEESVPRVRLPSISLKINENLNTNSSTVSMDPNSNNCGAKPVVLTGNLITLYDEDPTYIAPELEDSKQSSDDEEEDDESTEMPSEASVSSGGSDVASGMDVPSGSQDDVIVEEGEDPEDGSSSKLYKKVGKTTKGKRKGFANMKKSIHKMVKKGKTQFEKKNKSFKVAAIRQTYKRKIDPAKDIRSAIDRLALNPDHPFSAMIEEFIQKTREKVQSQKPDVMMRDIKQFMGGMRNFLFNRQVPAVDSVMDRYQDLSMDELDAIVEGALHLYLLKPLKDDIYQCFINEVKRNGSLAILDHNIQTAKSRSMEELGIRANYVPPPAEAMNEIKALITEMELSFSPIKKLDYLLKIVTSVYNTVVDTNSGRGVVQSMGADDFLPMFIYVLVQCEAVNIEVEADYMWGLLEPSKLSGEGGYYLTTLSSAICILKQLEQESQSETKGFLSVMVAIETEEINYRTIPVLPGMTSADICRIISHKMQIENAEDDYYLYLLTDEEVQLQNLSCPMYVKSDIESNESKIVRFGYRHKKHLVKWPPPTEE